MNYEPLEKRLRDGAIYGADDFFTTAMDPALNNENWHISDEVLEKANKDDREPRVIYKELWEPTLEEYATDLVVLNRKHDYVIQYTRDHYELAIKSGRLLRADQRWGQSYRELIKEVSHVASNKLRHGGDYVIRSTAGLTYVKLLLRALRTLCYKLRLDDNRDWNRSDGTLLELFTHMVMDNSSGEQNRWRPCAVVPKILVGGVYVRRSAEDEMRYVSNVAGVIDIVGVVTGGSLTGVQTARTMA